MNVDHGQLFLEVARVATLRGSNADRAAALSETLQRLVPFEGHWLALLDYDAGTFTPVVLAGYDERTCRRLNGPEAVAEVELAALERVSPARRTRDLPVPGQELATWAEYLWPAGFREALGVGSFTRMTAFSVCWG